MKRTKSRRSLPTILAREIHVASTTFHVFVHAVKPRGGTPTVESSPHLEMSGRFAEPIRGVQTMNVSVHADETGEPGRSAPPSIGGILQVLPELQVVVRVPIANFDRLWSLATAGLLKYVRVAFTEPYRRHALVVSVQFSNKSEDDETQSPELPRGSESTVERSGDTGGTLTGRNQQNTRTDENT